MTDPSKPTERRHKAPTDAQRDERVRLTVPVDEALEQLLGVDPEDPDKD